MSNTITEIKWTQLEDEEYEDTYHVVPILNEEIMKPHTLSESCLCHPEEELYIDGVIYVHNVIH
jgi:hypothetical protein